MINVYYYNRITEQLAGSLFGEDSHIFSMASMDVLNAVRVLEYYKMNDVSQHDSTTVLSPCDVTKLSITAKKKIVELTTIINRILSDDNLNHYEYDMNKFKAVMAYLKELFDDIDKLY